MPASVPGPLFLCPRARRKMPEDLHPSMGLQSTGLSETLSGYCSAMRCTLCMTVPIDCFGQVHIENRSAMQWLRKRALIMWLVIGKTGCVHHHGGGWNQFQRYYQRCCGIEPLTAICIRELQGISHASHPVVSVSKNFLLESSVLKSFDYFLFHKRKLKEKYIYEMNLFPSSILRYSEQKYISPLLWRKYILWKSFWFNSRMSSIPEGAVKLRVSVLPHAVVAGKLPVFNE